MNSESKPDPAGENSRRDFLQKIGAAAAVTSVAANASAQQPAVDPAMAARLAEMNAVPQAGPLAKQPMPTIRLGKHTVGRLVLGVNGIGTHYSTVLGRTFREWNTPEQQMKVFKHCEELGITMRIQTRDQINQYNKEFNGHMVFSSNYEAFTRGSEPNHKENLKKLAATGPIAIASSASGSDEFWRAKKMPAFREWVKMAKDTGCLVCLNGHIPEMYMEVESQGWGVDYYMPALYVFGRLHDEWEKAFKGDLDLAPLQVGELQTEYNSPYYGGEIAWVHGDPPKMLKVIKQAKTPCLAFKILASGNLMATAQAKVQQQIVEARFKYVLENIKPTDGIVCAMWNKYEDQYALNKEYVVKYSRA